MSDAIISERRPRAVICLEGSSELWNLLKRSLEGTGIPPDFIFARSDEQCSEVLALCRRLAPALVAIEDNRLPLIPLEQLRDLISAREINILVFSDKRDVASYAAFFHQGCTGVLPYSVTTDVLRRAVLAICEGELWLPRRVLSKLARDAFLNPSRRVTQRESEIFKLVCLGFTNQQIAEHLFISRETVRWHLRGLNSKIGVESRTGAIRYTKKKTSAD